jgi:hypothetical protein
MKDHHQNAVAGTPPDVVQFSGVGHCTDRGLIGILVFYMHTKALATVRQCAFEHAHVGHSLGEDRKSIHFVLYFSSLCRQYWTGETILGKMLPTANA